MKKFKIVAIKEGTRYLDTFEASDKRDAEDKLQKEGYFIISLKEVSDRTNKINILQRIVSKIKETIQRREDKARFRKQLLDFVSDGRFTENELKAIQNMENLELTDKELKSYLIEAYRAAFDKATADSVITEEEEKELNNIQRALNIQDIEIEKNKKALLRYRILSEIQKGNLPTIPNFTIPGIVFKKSEEVHWSERATLFEERVISRHHEGGYSGFSFRIAKGVRYHIGGYRGHPVSVKGNVPISEGKLLLTNKRVIFSGDKKSFAINLDKILDVKLYSDGIQFSEINKAAPRMIKIPEPANLDIIGAIISSAVSHLG